MHTMFSSRTQMINIRCFYDGDHLCQIVSVTLISDIWSIFEIRFWFSRPGSPTSHDFLRLSHENLISSSSSSFVLITIIIYVIFILFVIVLASIIGMKYTIVGSFAMKIDFYSRLEVALETTTSTFINNNTNNDDDDHWHNNNNLNHAGATMKYSDLSHLEMKHELNKDR